MTVALQRPAHNGRGLLFLALLAGVALMVVTTHAVTNSHTEQAWNSLRVLEQFKNGRDDCVKVEVAACPRREGTDGFTVRAFCQLSADPNYGIMGVWGYAGQGIYVTGFRQEYKRWISTCLRDNCLEADITLLYRMLE